MKMGDVLKGISTWIGESWLLSSIFGTRADAFVMWLLSKFKEVLEEVKDTNHVYQTFQKLGVSEEICNALKSMSEIQKEELKVSLEFLVSKEAAKKLKKDLKKVHELDYPQAVRNWIDGRLSQKSIPPKARGAMIELYVSLFREYLKKEQPEKYEKWFAAEQGELNKDTNAAVHEIAATVTNMDNTVASIDQSVTDIGNTVTSIDENVMDMSKKIDTIYHRGEGASAQASNTTSITPLTKFPARVEDSCFLHRTKEVQELRQIIEKNKGAAIVCGLGGIGKTTIARRLFHQLCEETDRYQYAAWVVYEGSLKQSIQKSFLLFQEEQLTPEERWAKQWNFLRANAAKTLFFIDNINVQVEDDAEMNDLRGLSATVVLTSRLMKIFNYQPYRVDFLEKEACLDLFYLYFNNGPDEVRQEEETARIIVEEKVRRHTLSVELVARYARKKISGGAASLKEVLDELEAKNFVYPEDIAVWTDHGDKTASIAAQLANLFDISAYEPGMQRIAKAFSILPSEDIPKAIARCIEAEQKDFIEMVELGLLVDRGDAYYMQPVIQESIRHQETVTGEDGKPKVVIIVEDCEKLMDCFSDSDFSKELSEGEAYRRAAYVQAFWERFGSDENLKKWIVYLLPEAIGNLYQNIGESKKALPYYEKSFELAKQQNDENPSASNRRLLSVSYEKVGNAHSAQGNAPKALENYEKALELRVKLNEESPSASSRRDLSVSYEKMGDAHSAQGNVPKALENYEKSFELAKQQNDENPSASNRRFLSVSYEKVGDAHSAQGNAPKALENYEKALGLREKLNEESLSASSRRDLSVSYERVGDAHRALGNARKELENYEKALGLREKLNEESPSASSRRDLSVSYNKVGDAHSDLGNARKALENYEKALELAKQLNEESPSASSRRDLSISYYNMGCYFATIEDFTQALTYLHQAEEGARFVDSQVNSSASHSELELLQKTIQEVEFLQLIKELKTLVGEENLEEVLQSFIGASDSEE